MSERWAGLLLGLVCLVWPVAAAAQDGAEGAEEGEEGLVKPIVTLPRIKAPIREEPKGFMPSRDFGAVLMMHQNRVLNVDSGEVAFEPKDEDPEFGVQTSQCSVGEGTHIGCGVTSAKVNQKQIKVSQKVGKKTRMVTKTVTWRRRKIGFTDNQGQFTQLAVREDSVPGSDPSVGTRYSMTIQGVFMTPDDTPTVLYSVAKTVTQRDSKNRIKSKTTQESFLWQGERACPFRLGGEALDGGPVQRNSGSGAGHASRVNPLLQFAMRDQDICIAYATDARLGPIMLECISANQCAAAKTPSAPSGTPPKKTFQTSLGAGAATTASGTTITTLVEEAMYDFRFKGGRDGWMYLFYHDPSAESAMVTSSKDGATWTPMVLDTKESGWQLDAAVGPEKTYVMYYYFRNSYNKGLRIAGFQGGKLVEGPNTIVREADFNTGWYPYLGIAPKGGVWVTYWDDVLKKTRAWARLKNPRAINKHVIQDTGGWEDGYKNWFLQTGVGGWYTLWQPFDRPPSTEDTDTLTVGSTRYEIADSLLTTVAFEGKLYGVSLGLSYARSIVQQAEDELKERFGDAPVDFFSGQLKIDSIFPGHDIKVQLTSGRYRGLATPGDGVIFAPQAGSFDGAIEIDTQYLDAQALFLNKWRMKYGLTVGSYSLPMVLHAWHAGQDEETYQYKGSYFRQTDAVTIKALFGYSTLDYVSKYENRYNGLIFDGFFDGGIALLSFDSVELLNVEESVEDAFTLDLRLSLNLGWLYFKRFHSARGFGFYIQPAYAAEGSFTGLASRPSDRDLSEEDADTDPDTYISPSVLGVRHGPRVDIGIVW